MTTRFATVVALGALMLALCPATGVQADTTNGPAFDAALARAVGADERGMRGYVLVLLKTGPTRVPDGKERDEMFKGHLINIARLAEEGKLAFAGPLDGAEGLRGLFVFAVPDIETAKKYVATDPVIVRGEMTAEYHDFYGSAALMLVNEAHKRIMIKRP